MKDIWYHIITQETCKKIMKKETEHPFIVISLEFDKKTIFGEEKRKYKIEQFFDTIQDAEDYVRMKNYM
jgi:hypothetical protein